MKRAYQVLSESVKQWIIEKAHGALCRQYTTPRLVGFKVQEDVRL